MCMKCRRIGKELSWMHLRVERMKVESEIILILCHFRFPYPQINVIVLFKSAIIVMMWSSHFLRLRRTCVQLLLMGCTSSKHELSQEDLEFLKAHTSYSEKKIKTWYKGFMVRRHSHRRSVDGEASRFITISLLLERLSQRWINTRFVHSNLQAILSQRTCGEFLRTCLSCFRYW